MGLYTPHLPYVFLFLQKFLKNLSGNQTGPHLEHATDYLFHFEYNTLKTITKTKTDQCQKQANSRDLKKKKHQFLPILNIQTFFKPQLYAGNVFSSPIHPFPQQKNPAYGPATNLHRCLLKCFFEKLLKCVGE